ncbi:MAG: hypothetical protein CMP48_09435 [Rickettsiales bacterium]|nr:hypothetical protein [Rickettsiales bacterium]
MKVRFRAVKVTLRTGKYPLGDFDRALGYPDYAFYLPYFSVGNPALGIAEEIPSGKGRAEARNWNIKPDPKGNAQ